MAGEVTYTAGGYDMIHLGRGKGLLSLVCTTENDKTITTGFKRINGMGYGVVDAAVDAHTQVLACAISTGTITLYQGDIHDHTSISGTTYLLIEGHLH